MRVKQMFGLAAGAIAVTFLCVPVLAQPLGGGGRFNFDEAAKAWEPEAQSVAKSLSLTEDQSKKLVDAYKASRESFQKSAMAAFQSGAGQGSAREALRKLATDERGKLETQLNTFLKPEETSKAMAALGTFSMQRDLMVNSLNTLGLDDKVKADAMAAVNTYIAETDKAREAAGSDRGAMRTKIGELRTKLDADLAKVLSAEQVTKLKALPGFGLRGPGAASGHGPKGAVGGNAPSTPPAAPSAAPNATK